MFEVEMDKGGKAEELLREYFLQEGYFVARGVKAAYRSTEITDIDLWLYASASVLSKVRLNVDAKRRGSPKALERILWAKGLQKVLGFDHCIVATTDKRPLVKEYGRRHDVAVLDGHFMEYLFSRSISSSRLSEEDFLLLLGEQDKLTGDWRGRLWNAKSRLAGQLGFDACNAWLDDARYFIEQALISSRSEAACRLTYLTIAFFLIGLDYSLVALSFERKDSQRTLLEEGFRYGSNGKARTEDKLRSASNLIQGYSSDKRALGERIRSQVLNDLGKIPADILSEYFARKDIQVSLLKLGRDFEARAFDRQFLTPQTADGSMQGVMGVLLDFYRIDREKFFSKF